MRKLMLAVAVVSSACPSPSSPDGGDAGGPASFDDGLAVASGSRLKVQWLAADGGARHFLAFYDTTLALACSPQDFGARRVCLPAVSFTDSFEDSACTKPVFFESPDPCQRSEKPVAIAATAETVNGCSAGEPRVFRASATTQAFTTTYQRADGGCVAQNRPPGATQNAYTAGAPFDSATFATFRTESAPRGAVTAQFDVADDGARALRALRLSNTPGTVRLFADGGGHVVPETTAYVISSAKDFSDSACRTEAAYSYARCSDDSPYITVYEEQACGVTVSYRERGALVADGGSWRQTAQGCTFTAEAEKRLYGVGAPVATATFPRAKTLEVGTGRVRARVASDDSSSRLSASAEFFDLSFGARCHPRLASDGTRTCSPAASSSTEQYFADAACTQLLFGVVPSPCQTTPEAFVETVPLDATGNPACGPRTTRRLRARFSGSVYLKDSSGACGPTNASNFELYQTEAVPQASLERLFIITE